ISAAGAPSNFSGSGLILAHARFAKMTRCDSSIKSAGTGRACNNLLNEVVLKCVTSKLPDEVTSATRVVTSIDSVSSKGPLTGVLLFFITVSQKNPRLAPHYSTYGGHSFHNLRTTLRDFLIRGKLSIRKFRPCFYGILAARERGSCVGPTGRHSVHHRETHIVCIGGKITNRLRYWNIDGRST